MERDVPLHLNRSVQALLLVALLLMGCARGAPELPEEYGSSDMSLSASYEKLPDAIKNADCSVLKQELAALDKNDQILESKIHANRKKNQVAGYFSALLFPPAFLILDNDDPTKSSLAFNQQLRDQIFIAQRMKNCS